MFISCNVCLLISLESIRKSKLWKECLTRRFHHGNRCIDQSYVKAPNLQTFCVMKKETPRENRSKISTWEMSENTEQRLKLINGSVWSTRVCSKLPLGGSTTVGIQFLNWCSSLLYCLNFNLLPWEKRNTNSHWIFKIHVSQVIK